MKNQITLHIIVLLTGNSYKTGKEDGVKKKNCTEYVLNEYTEFCTIHGRERGVLGIYKTISGIRLVHVWGCLVKKVSRRGVWGRWLFLWAEFSPYLGACYLGCLRVTYHQNIKIQFWLTFNLDVITECAPNIVNLISELSLLWLFCAYSDTSYALQLPFT